MKKTLSLLTIVCLSGLCFSGTANAAPLITTNYITQTLTNSVGATGYTFNFNKFDQSLGTLSGVNFTIVSSDDQGSFTVTNSLSSSVKVYNPTDYLDVIDLQGSGADFSGSTVTLTTSPDTGTTRFNGATLGANSLGTYTLSPADQSLASNVFSAINSSFWNLYQSSNGSGFVSFTAFNSPQVSVTGGAASFDMSGVLANTVLKLDYVYTVPEPSTYALFGLGGLALVIAARRKRTA